MMTVALVGRTGDERPRAARMAARDDYPSLHVGRRLRTRAARGDVEVAARLTGHLESREVRADVTAELGQGCVASNRA